MWLRSRRLKLAKGNSPRSNGSAEKPPRSSKRRTVAGRRPFRSRILGWGAKLIGLGWLLASIAVLWQEDVHLDFRISYLLLLPGFGLIYLGSRLCLRTFGEGQHPDSRPPIIYLRAFADDGRGTLQPTDHVAKLHGIGPLLPQGGIFKLSVLTAPIWLIHPTKVIRLFFGTDLQSSEELLGAAFRRFGPFIAIGKPGEWVATAGADRMYVSHEDWQHVVLESLECCQAVVLQPGNSKGVRWEFERTFERVPRHRILLNLMNFRDNPNDYEEFRTWLSERTSMRLPRTVPFLRQNTFVYFEVDGTPRLQRVCYSSPLRWSFTCNAVDNEQTFHTFFQGLAGGQRDLPRQPRRRPVHAALSASIAIVCVLATLTPIYVLVHETSYGRMMTEVVRRECREVLHYLGL